MLVCPKNGYACMDDICRGSGCIEMDGYQMLRQCDFCGGWIDAEIPECSTCTCDDDGEPADDR